MAELSVEEAGIIDRLLQIIADEGLVDRGKLEPGICWATANSNNAPRCVSCLM
jgi:hypothetical protein